MDETPLFPVAAITVGPVAAYGIITIRLDFLTHLTQRPEEAQTGRHYALTPDQARYLAERISSALRLLETGATPGSGFPQH